MRFPITFSGSEVVLRHLLVDDDHERSTDAIAIVEVASRQQMEFRVI